MRESTLCDTCRIYLFMNHFFPKKSSLIFSSQSSTLSSTNFHSNLNFVSTFQHGKRINRMSVFSRAVQQCARLTGELNGHLRPFLLGSGHLSATLSQQRNLYTEDALGLTGFRRERNRVSNEFGPLKEKFIQRMRSSIDDEKLLFTEDLRNFLHAIEPNEEGSKILHGLLVKYCKQNTDTRFTTFVFGPVVMRYLASGNLHEDAFQFLKDERLHSLFNSVMSYWIVMDLLFKNDRFAEIIELYELMSKLPIENKFPNDVMNIVHSALFKMGTPEALNKALSYINGCKENGYYINRRSVACVSALALKNDRPQLTTELALLVRNSNFVTIRNLRILAFLKMQRYEDVLLILKQVINYGNSNAAYDGPNRSPILPDVVLEIEKSLGSLDDSLQKEFKLVLQNLRDSDKIGQKTLEECILEVATANSGQVFAAKRRQTTQNQSISRNRRYDRREMYS